LFCAVAVEERNLRFRKQNTIAVQCDIKTRDQYHEDIGSKSDAGMELSKQVVYSATTFFSVLDMLVVEDPPHTIVHTHSPTGNVWVP
jgi:hypothetical protein